MAIAVSVLQGSPDHEAYASYPPAGGFQALDSILNTAQIYGAIVPTGSQAILTANSQLAPDGIPFPTYPPGTGLLALDSEMNMAQTYGAIVPSGSQAILTANLQLAPDGLPYPSYPPGTGLIATTYATFHSLLDSEFPAGSGGGESGPTQTWSIS